MPKIVSVERENDVRILFHFSAATREFRDRLIEWVKKRFKDLIVYTNWRQTCDTLIVVVRRAEAALAYVALKEELPRRALFK